MELDNSEIFEVFSLFQIFKNSNLTFENIQNSIVDGSDDGGIDSIMVLIDDDIIESITELNEYKFKKNTNTKIIISQCKKEKSFKESTLDKLITSIPILFNLEVSEADLLKRFNVNVVDLGLLARDIWLKTATNGGKTSLEFIYVTNASKIELSNLGIPIGKKKAIKNPDEIHNSDFHSLLQIISVTPSKYMYNLNFARI